MAFFVAIFFSIELKNILYLHPMHIQQRGISVFNGLLFDEEDQSATVTTTITNGRNPEFIAKRDNFLLHRFYYKTKIQRKIYSDTLNELSSELWLSKLMIQKIIQAKADNILMIKKQPPSLKMLQEVWPHIKW